MPVRAFFYAQTLFNVLRKEDVGRVCLLVDRSPCISKWDVAEQCRETGDLFQAQDLIPFHAEMLGYPCIRASQLVKPLFMLWMA